jgi:hypothetical protein
MTSGFSYKGIDIYTITDNKGVAVPGYSFKGTTNTETGLRPLPFNLTYQNTSVSNFCTAANTGIITTSGTANIPTGCKHIAFYGRGGGGGGGGVGGNANVKIDGFNGVTDYAGSGGAGVTSGYMYGYQISTEGQSSISYIIGTGGNAGSIGTNNQVTTPGGKGAETKGGDGGNGNQGNVTSIKIVDSVYTTNNASGGNGGGGAKVNYSGTSFKSADGAPGSTPPPSTQPNNTYNSSVTFPALNAYGNGGPAGSKGGDGALQIFWLYD